MNKATVLLLAVLALTGCAQSVKPSGVLNSGYRTEKAPGELLRVTFKGAPFVSDGDLGTYLIYSCADIAKRDGKPYFAFYQTLGDAVMDRRAATKEAASTLIGPQVWGFMLYFDEPESGLLSTEETLARLGPQVNRGRAK